MACKSVNKVCFVVLNSILFACAIIEIVIAAVIYGRVYALDMLSSLLNASAMIILMTAGVLSLLCSAFGIFGLKLHMRWILFVYLAISVVIFILQVAGFSTAFHSVSSNLVKYLTDAFAEIKSKDDKTFVESSWWKMQQSLSCCGVTGPDELGAGKQEQLCICDMKVTKNCGPKSYYTTGCFNAIIWYASDFTLGAAALSVSMAIIQLITGVISFVLARNTESVDWAVQQKQEATS
ncbi:23 kDa integral membrane protein-like [Cloeon dipterum]|uniref:23 kDa integral membrane protein-like n=1 Tax=Cloeon dipterum TaxID=197152 RepID=UPI003220799E